MFEPTLAGPSPPSMTTQSNRPNKPKWILSTRRSHHHDNNIHVSTTHENKKAEPTTETDNKKERSRTIAREVKQLESLHIKDGAIVGGCDCIFAYSMHNAEINQIKWKLVKISTNITCILWKFSQTSHSSLITLDQSISKTKSTSESRV